MLSSNTLCLKSQESHVNFDALSVFPHEKKKTRIFLTPVVRTTVKTAISPPI